MKDENIKDTPPQQMAVISAPEKSIAKFCTNIAITKLKNKDIVMTFLSKNAENAPAVLIETIIVDEEHAKKILEVFTRVINNSDNQHA